MENNYETENKESTEVYMLVNATLSDVTGSLDMWGIEDDSIY